MKQNLVILAIAIFFSFLGLSFDALGAINYFIPIGNSEIFNFILNVLMWFYILLLIYKLILFLIIKILEYLKNTKIRINNYLQNLNNKFHEIKIIAFINSKFFNEKGLPLEKFFYLPNVIIAIIIVIILSNIFDNEAENNYTRAPNNNLETNYNRELPYIDYNDPGQTMSRYQAQKKKKTYSGNTQKERVSCYLTNVDEDNLMRRTKPCQYNCNGKLVYKMKSFQSIPRKCAVEIEE